jgi:hypothetical protein
MVLLLCCRPTPSITSGVDLLAVASHVRIKLVPGFVFHFHLIADPFGLVALPFLITKALVFLDVGMWFAALEDVAMGAGVGRMVGATAASSVVAASAVLIVVPSVATVLATVASVVEFVGGGVTVRVEG